MGEPAISTIAIDPVTGDIAIPMRLIYGREALAQRLRHRFSFFLGEWYLDLRKGTPYFEHILGIRKPNERLVRTILRQVIENTPGVARVIRDSFDFDQAKRKLTYNELEIAATDGSTYRIQPEPFIIKLPVPQ